MWIGGTDVGQAEDSYHWIDTGASVTGTYSFATGYPVSPPNKDASFISLTRGRALRNLGDTAASGVVGYICMLPRKYILVKQN